MNQDGFNNMDNNNGVSVGNSGVKQNQPSVVGNNEYGKEPVTFTSYTYGTIAKEKQGQYGWSWDFI